LLSAEFAERVIVAVRVSFGAVWAKLREVIMLKQAAANDIFL
jgi:hypothetical protein